MTYYKWLKADRMPGNGGSGQWPPPGEVLHVDPPLIPCKYALHLCRVQDLSQWILVGELWKVEVPDGAEIEILHDKVVTTDASLVRLVGTLDERAMRHLACDFAEHVLHIFEDEYPGDDRVRNCIETARRYADGEATREELASARDALVAVAARAAAGAAAWYAVWAAADVALTSAWAAAWASADAAHAAASTVAGAAGGEERMWQGQRILEVLEGK